MLDIPGASIARSRQGTTSGPAVSRALGGEKSSESGIVSQFESQFTSCYKWPHWLRYSLCKRGKSILSKGVLCHIMENRRQGQGSQHCMDWNGPGYHLMLECQT